MTLHTTQSSLHAHCSSFSDTAEHMLFYCPQWAKGESQYAPGTSTGPSIHADHSLLTGFRGSPWRQSRKSTMRGRANVSAFLPGGGKNYGSEGGKRVR